MVTFSGKVTSMRIAEDSPRAAERGSINGITSQTRRVAPGSAPKPGERFPAGAQVPGFWRRSVGASLGEVILAVCPQAKKECNNPHCVFQPLCACARAELQRSGRIENRFWIALAVCAAVLLLVAFAAALIAP